MNKDIILKLQNLKTDLQTQLHLKLQLTPFQVTQDYMVALNEAIEELMGDKNCTWSPYKSGYKTGCRGIWVNGKPKGFTYCPYCGGEIHLTKYHS